MFKKTFYIILIIAAALNLASCSFYNMEISGGGQYNNKYLEFSLKLPKNWVIEEKGNLFFAGVSFYDPEHKEYITIIGAPTLLSQKKIEKDGVIFEDWVDGFINKNKFTGLKVISRRKIFFSGQEAYEIISKSLTHTDSRQRNIFFEENSRYYVVSYTVDNNPGIEKINNALETLQFGK